jgi:hypothetical protein
MNPRIAALLASSLLASGNAWSCFAPPDAKPSSELSELSLLEKPIEPSVVHTVGKYAIYIKPDALLQLLVSKEYHALIRPHDILDALRSSLPLTADLDTIALLATFEPPPPSAGDKQMRNQVALDYKYFWDHAQPRLGYIVADLIEQGDVAVVDLVTNEALRTITRDQYSEVCSGGRRFIAPSGEVFLSTFDWVS